MEPKARDAPVGHPREHRVESGRPCRLEEAGQEPPTDPVPPGRLLDVDRGLHRSVVRPAGRPGTQRGPAKDPALLDGHQDPVRWVPLLEDLPFGLDRPRLGIERCGGAGHLAVVDGDDRLGVGHARPADRRPYRRSSSRAHRSPRVVGENREGLLTRSTATRIPRYAPSGSAGRRGTPPRRPRRSWRSSHLLPAELPAQTVSLDPADRVVHNRPLRKEPALGEPDATQRDEASGELVLLPQSVEVVAV